MDLFTNPFVKEAEKALSPKQKEDYQRQGEYMYGNLEDYVVIEDNKPKMDYVEIKKEETKPPQQTITNFAKVVEYIEESIKSGQHISFLTDAEKQIMAQERGKKWFRKYGYKKRDLTEIFTFPN